MTPQGSRADLEKDLARALSRHIGYTTGAYHLQRIVSTLEIFHGTPSAYITELVEVARASVPHADPRLEEQKGLSSHYLEEVVHFAEAMSLIYTVSQKTARLRRLAPTETGRALMGAQASGDEQFLAYLLTKIVLFADADAMFPVMDYYSRPHDITRDEYYLEFQTSLRNNRASWLDSAFPESLLLTRIVSYISWLSIQVTAQGRLRIENLALKTAKHHARPRQGWLYRLGLLNRETMQLTQFGRAVHGGLMRGGQYFWLGPNSFTQRYLRIVPNHHVGGPFEDTFDPVVDPRNPEHRVIDKLVDDTAAMMRSGYAATKLIHAEQATLRLPIEYIKYRRIHDRMDYEWRDIVAHVFAKYRNEFVRLSPKRGQIGFFQWNGGT